MTTQREEIQKILVLATKTSAYVEDLNKRFDSNSKNCTLIHTAVDAKIERVSNRQNALMIKVAGLSGLVGAGAVSIGHNLQTLVPLFIPIILTFF